MRRSKHMGIFDIFKKPKKQGTEYQHPPTQPAQQEPILIESVTVPQQPVEDKPKLDLVKKIGLSFEKLNLDKEDVRSKRLFVLDVSGSMDEQVGGKNGKRKIDSLKEVMSKYPDANMLSFADRVKKISDVSELSPNGGTNLAYALRYIKSDIKPLPEGLVLVSDGEPNDEHDALKEALSLALPIDIIFIGKEKSKGANFMEKLASETGGQHFIV